MCRGPVGSQQTNAPCTGFLSHGRCAQTIIVGIDQTGRTQLGHAESVRLHFPALLKDQWILA